MTGDGDFWSRRKAAVQAEQEAEAARAENAALRAELAEREARPDAEILAELDLPDPDTLGPGDSIAGFMSRAVPDRLRRRALRKLWTLNPALANLDGLVDYGEDYSAAPGMTGKLQTAYQVGKGMLAHLEAMARQAEDAAARVAAADIPQPAPAVTDAAPLPAPEDRAALQDRTALAGPAEPPAEPDISAPVPRRMRFAFQG